MAHLTDIMVDVETTGLNPHTSSIIQLSAIKFNYMTGEIGEAFDRCPGRLPFRGWHDGTREFWMGGKNYDVYKTIVAREEPAPQVFADFHRFAREGAPVDGYRFWSKPLTFDWPIVASHMEQLGADMPFHYRYARDQNSFIAGLRGDPEHVSMENVVPFQGDEHNALHDCAFQLDCLLAAKAGNFTEIL